MLRRTSSRHSQLVDVRFPRELTEAGSRRELPTLGGLSREEVYQLLASVSIDGAPPAEIAAYLSEDFERFVLTADLVNGLSGSALEVGANPYFTTVLLREFTDLKVTLTNNFDSKAVGIYSQQVTYEPPGQGPQVCLFEYHSLEAESMVFPFADSEFDVVLFCEVIEHLLSDPAHALLEIKRVLKPGGVLVVTTPNVARLENVARLAAGVNIYDPYSGYGPYGRHNREYTRHELVGLLMACGFEVPHHFTADVHPHHATSFTHVPLLEPLLGHRTEDLGQYIFCRALNAGPARDGRPAWLYRSMPNVTLFD